MPPRPQVGIVYAPGMAGVLAAIPDAFDVLEIEPQTLSLALAGHPGAAPPSTDDLSQVLAFPHPKVVHSVGLPFGNAPLPAPAEIAAVRFAAEELDSPWVSDHLSFNRGGHGFAGFLLPLPQTAEAARRAAARIRWARRMLGRPVLFETGVNYLQPTRDEMGDGEFFGAVATWADCGILLDLHNLWANDRNGREPLGQVIDELPLDRVVEVHLAHGYDRSGYWIDAHSGLTSPELLDVAASIIPRLPNVRLITFEVAPDYLPVGDITAHDLARHLDALRQLSSRSADQREGARHDSPGRRRRGRRLGQRDLIDRRPCPGLDAWRNELALLVNGRTVATDVSAAMLSDPGLRLYQELISVGRASVLVSAAPLTARLLLMLGGTQRLESLVDDFQANSDASNLPLDELRSFEAFLTAESSPALDLVREVLRFERAVLETAADSRPRTVTFSTEPTALLQAIGAGRTPRLATDQSIVYDLTIEPARHGDAGLQRNPNSP